MSSANTSRVTKYEQFQSFSSFPFPGLRIPNLSFRSLQRRVHGCPKAHPRAQCMQVANLWMFQPPYCALARAVKHASTGKLSPLPWITFGFRYVRLTHRPLLSYGALSGLLNVQQSKALFKCRRTQISKACNTEEDALAVPFIVQGEGAHVSG